MDCQSQQVYVNISSPGDGGSSGKSPIRYDKLMASEIPAGDRLIPPDPPDPA